MSVEKEIQARSGSKCEFCGAIDDLKVYEVPPYYNAKADQCVLVCETCLVLIENPEKMDANHWRCLNDSMWNPVPAVQVMVWRMLHRLSAESWSHDLLDMLYLDEDTLKWAQATGEGIPTDDLDIKHIDSNGVVLQGGDTVVLIKDLEVRGAGFTAKRGTPVRGIRLVADNPEHIEGRVEGQQIVILTKFVKKST